jgi:hypothetical protein
VALQVIVVLQIERSAAPAGAGSDGNQVDVQAGNCGEIPQVIRIRGVDLVAVVGEEDNGRIDDIGLSSGAQQDTSPATQAVIKGVNIDTWQETRQGGLAPGATSPYLADHPAMTDGRPAFPAFPLDQGDHVAVVSLDGKERTGVEHDTHAAPRFRR